jgi:hypothetical protein
MNTEHTVGGDTPDNLLKNTVVRLRFQLDVNRGTLYVAAEAGKGEPDEPQTLQAVQVLAGLLAEHGVPHEMYQRNTAVRGVSAVDAVLLSYPKLRAFLTTPGADSH